MPKKSLLTATQLGNLTEEGRMAEAYWRDFLPKMYREMAQKGTLYPTLDRKGTEWSDRVDQMIQDGLAEDGALEVVKEEIYSLPPEK